MANGGWTSGQAGVGGFAPAWHPFMTVTRTSYIWLEILFSLAYLLVTA